MKHFILLLFIFLPIKIKLDSFKSFTIWNVGQGQWVTLSTAKECLHIDAGGERAPWRRVKKLCKHKDNRVYLTHYDWDHIRFIRRLKRQLPGACLATKIHYPISVKKRKWLNRLRPCPTSASSPVELLFSGGEKGTNDRSRVFSVARHILVPGDSPTSQEKKWVKHLNKNFDTLVLGHHGSRTSSSERLLKAASIRQAIASARRKKYGHPHPVVIQRLKQHKIPLLSTEEWGHIHLLMQK